MINALNSEKESWAIKEGNENEIEELLLAAALLPPAEASGIKHEHIGNPETTPDWFEDDVSSDVEGDTDTVADILNMIKDEIDFEVAHGIVSTEEDEEETRENEALEGPGEVDPDKYLFKRFGALGSMNLPPVPKSEPGINPMPKLPAAATETDTWCCRFSYLVSATPSELFRLNHLG